MIGGLLCILRPASIPLVQICCKAGADLSARIADECTPLHLAARHNTYTAVTKMLLDLRSAVDSREVNEWTLLHLAARYWCGRYDWLEFRCEETNQSISRRDNQRYR